MLTFGMTTTVDVLSWIVSFALGLKVVVTLILLIVGKEIRDQPGWGSALWWATKITPIIAVPCLIWMARSENDESLMRLSLALGLFVIVAVPIKVWQRRNRIAKRPRTKLLVTL